MYALLIILFTFFYTFVQINPEKRQKTFKRVVPISQVSVLVGDRRVYVSFVRRLATVGSVFLGFITIIPILARDLFGFDRCSCFGGTSLLIIISQVLRNETIRRLLLNVSMSDLWTTTE